MLAGLSSSLSLDDTIAAIASAPGGGVRGIVRISGVDCAAVVGKVFREPLPQRGNPICLNGEIQLPPPLGTIPAKLLFWPTRRSYTRQPTAEVHTFGSPPILQALLDELCRAGARLARPGEFTLRAFLAGRIDLPQAEAVLGVIDAVDESALGTALVQLAGGFSQPLARLRSDLLDLLAHLEAGLDFVEEDIEFISRAELDQQLTAAVLFVEELEARMQSRGSGSELPRVVLVGPPNAGKSSAHDVAVAQNSLSGLVQVPLGSFSSVAIQAPSLTRPSDRKSVV